jgi:hypothetical protein
MVSPDPLSPTPSAMNTHKTGDDPEQAAKKI